MLAAVTAHNGHLMVPASDPVKIKVYGNRRLFQPAAGRYVTFAELIDLAKDEAGVVVRDAQTGADITAFILSHHSTEH
jgi:polyhydroxyalkanoate synthesis regulator protein